MEDQSFLAVTSKKAKFLYPILADPYTELISDSDTLSVGAFRMVLPIAYNPGMLNCDPELPISR